MIVELVVFSLMLLVFFSSKDSRVSKIIQAMMYPNLAINLIFAVETLILFSTGVMVELRFQDDSDVLQSISKLDNLKKVSKYQEYKREDEQSEARSYRSRIDSFVSNLERDDSQVFMAKL